MIASHFDQHTAMTAAASLPPASQEFKGTAARVIERTGIGTGTRIMNRVFLGIWISLLLALWHSSDWIGLLVLSQALFAAARLLRSSTTNDGSAHSAGNMAISNAPTRMDRGEYGEQ
ncbi:MAG TPA: hypothetical protein VH308_01505 [Terracidiphilus sp.]|jgi:hypothetical protein|nr:hypothetical protein [Terracidiphilus sp.]